MKYYETSFFYRISSVTNSKILFIISANFENPRAEKLSAQLGPWIYSTYPFIKLPLEHTLFH